MSYIGFKLRIIISVIHVFLKYSSEPLTSVHILATNYLPLTYLPPIEGITTPKQQQ